MSEDFPKFEPRFDKIKLLHRLSWNPLDWAPIHLSRANSAGIVNPVIKHVDNTMAHSGLTEKILGLNTDVLEACKAGKNPADIKKIIDDFGTNNGHLLDAFHDNLLKLHKHIDDTYSTNEVTRWTSDLTREQKQALLKYVEEIAKLCDDMKEGVRGANGQEILRNVEKIRNKDLDFDKVSRSITGLSRSHFWTADSKIRQTGQWLDNSGPAWLHWQKRLQREINLGYFNHHEYTDNPIIYNAENERGIKNSKTGENLENPWQLFIENWGKRDENGYLVNQIGDSVELKGSYDEDLDTIISGGYGNTAVETVIKLTRLLQSKVKNTDSATPYPTKAKWDRAVAAEVGVSPWKKFYFNAIGDAIDLGERTKPGAAEDTWSTLGLYERWWERNRYTQAKHEANRYFWDYRDEFRGSGLLATPAYLQVKTGIRYYLSKPFAYVLGADTHTVGKKEVFGFKFKNYYGGRDTQWFGTKPNPTDPANPKRDILGPLRRASLRLPSGFMFHDWKWSDRHFSLFAPEWVGLKTTILGKSATIGAYFMAAGSATGLVSTDLLDWANEHPNAGASPYIQAAAPYAKNITPSLNSTSQDFMAFSNLYGWVPNPSKMAYDAAYDSVKEKISGGKTESPSSKNAPEINQDALQLLNRGKTTPPAALPGIGTPGNITPQPQPQKDFKPTKPPERPNGVLDLSYNTKQTPAFNYAAAATTAQTSHATDWKSEQGLGNQTTFKLGPVAFNTVAHNISGKTAGDSVQWDKINEGSHTPTEFTV